MRFDYEYGEDMRLNRFNPNTEKYARVPGLFGNEATAKKAAVADLLRLQNLNKKLIPYTARFSGAGEWEEI